MYSLSYCSRWVPYIFNFQFSEKSYLIFFLARYEFSRKFQWYIRWYTKYKFGIFRYTLNWIKNQYVSAKRKWICISNTSPLAVKGFEDMEQFHYLEALSEGIFNKARQVYISMWMFDNVRQRLIQETIPGTVRC